MTFSTSLITELDDAIKTGQPERRLETLRRVTGLFVEESIRLNEQQIGVFDEVLVHLIQRIESKALVQLSKDLAPLDKAPIKVIQSLARNDEIEISGPVLSQSNRLSENDLIEIASTKSQGHLLAMSGRKVLTESLTDVLVERGNTAVTHKLATNVGARFSQSGYSRMVQKADGDDGLAESLGLRSDIPKPMLQQLLLRATDTVRSRLLASATPENQEKIQQALASIAGEIRREVAKPLDFSGAESVVQTLNRQGKLNEKMLAEFARRREYENAAACLALFCAAPIETIDGAMKHSSPEGILIACKAAGMSWPTAALILSMRVHPPSDRDLDEAKKSFETLSQPLAQRTMRFMLVQGAAKKSSGGQLH
jgi:uncharacterized protein (DUF2336 family)